MHKVMWRFWAYHGEKYDAVLREVEKLAARDVKFSTGRVLGSMYTSPHPIAVEAHMRLIEANLGNPGLCRGTAEMEKALLQMSAELLSANYGKNGVLGHTTSGGTESNITALWMARKIFGRGKVLCSESAHFSVDKACEILGLEILRCPLDEELKLSADTVSDHMDENVIAVVAVAGSTEFGTVDDIEGIADIVGKNAILHVDAAFGGFVLPFMKMLGLNTPKFDFGLKNVASMSVDPHKMGFATIPCGVFMARKPFYASLPKFDVPYLTTKMHMTLLGTRGSGAVAGAYAVMKHLGVTGYLRIVARCLENTRYFLRLLAEHGIEPVISPPMNIVAIETSRADEIVKEMQKKGWYLSTTKKPKCVRVVVMPHVSRSVIEMFVPEFVKALG